MSGVDAPAEVREPPFGQLRLGATHRLERRALEGGEVGSGWRRRGSCSGGAVRPPAAYGDDAAARRVRGARRHSVLSNAAIPSSRLTPQGS